MKTNLFRTSIVALIAAAAAYAQGPLIANVPFDFIAGHQTLSAGQYKVDLTTVHGGVAVKSIDHRGAAMVMGAELFRPSAAQGRGKLVFHRCGNTYFLSEVWGAENYGRQLPESKRERELTATGPAVGAITIAAIR